MQAYLIDPTECTITPVEHDGDYRQIYSFIGADCFDAARFNDRGDAVFIDDEGLFKKPERFFSITGYGDDIYPLAGKGLVLGCDAEGETVAPTVDLEWLRDNVRFLRMIAGGVFVSVGARHMVRED